MRIDTTSVVTLSAVEIQHIIQFALDIVEVGNGGGGIDTLNHAPPESLKDVKNRHQSVIQKLDSINHLDGNVEFEVGS